MGILSKLTIATIGTLPHERQQVRRWVEANGGKWSNYFRKGVTHLVASKDAWKKADKEVQLASDLGAWIVSYDWLEDSLQGKRKLGEKKYTWEFLGKEKKKRRQLKKLGKAADGTSSSATVARNRERSRGFFFSTSTPSILSTPFVSATEDLKWRRAEREAAQAAANGVSGSTAQIPVEIEDECASQVRLPSSPATSTSATLARFASTNAKPLHSPAKSKAANPASTAGTQAKTPHFKDLYHYYLDTTGFEYKILLVRSDFSSNNFARYHIGLLESHTKPHAYCTIVQYAPPAKKSPDFAGDAPGFPATRSALLCFNKNFTSEATPQHGSTNGVSNGNRQTSTQDSEAARLQAPITPTHPSYAIPQQGPFAQSNDASEHHAEAARLASLISSPATAPDTPYKSLICPMNSDYPTAWRAFRHAFRDLTLLSWEERYDTNKTIQKARAQQLGIEPFLYSKPKKGLPIGLLPQEAGLFQGNASSGEVRGDSDDGYVGNAFNLPSIAHPLSKNGAIGSAIYREEEDRKRVEEEKRIKAEEKEEMERKRRGEVKEKKPNYNRPMFNGATGRPQVDAYGRYTTNALVGGRGVDMGAYAGMIKRSKPWPRDRYE